MVFPAPAQTMELPDMVPNLRVADPAFIALCTSFAI
jgi:hypothetical protein